MNRDDSVVTILAITCVLALVVVGIAGIFLSSREREKTAQVALANHCSQVIEEGIRGTVVWKCPSESITK